jgi:hypothetical protein
MTNSRSTVTLTETVRMVRPVSERHVTSPIALCDDAGNLNRAAVGWSEKPRHHLNFQGRNWRRKRYDAWGVQCGPWYFCGAVVNLGYAGYGFAFLLDIERRELHERSCLNPLGRGAELAEEVGGGSSITGKGLSFRTQPYGSREMDSGLTQGMNLTAAAKLRDGRTLKCDLRVAYAPNLQTMNVVIPWNERQFHFTCKQNALPVSGTMSIGDQTIVVRPEESAAWLDFGRGIWPYRSHWNWTIGTSVAGGRRVGFNLGSGWTDGTGMTENALYIDGKVEKLAEPVNFRYNPRRIMEPWEVRTEGSERVRLTFEPLFDRYDASNLLIVRSQLHQLIGRYHGTIVSAAGERIAIENVIAVAEEHFARW